MQNGDHYIYGLGGYDGTNPSSAKTLQQVIAECGSSMTEITWSELKSLRDNSQLIPGMQYRITDYITTTVQENTQSAGHQFDIIVVADDVNKLNENARAILHSGDTYFSGVGAKLDAWQLKYCLDNDTTRFVWADDSQNNGIVVYGRNYYFSNESKIVEEEEYYKFVSESNYAYYCTSSSPNIGDTVYIISGDYITDDGHVENIIPATTENGKGVIYWMKDEWNNECPYDFKNIKFLRYKIAACPKSPSLVGQYSTNDTNSITVDATTTYWCYTFTWINANDEIEDLSIVGQTLQNDEGQYSGVFDNKIESLNSYELYPDSPSSFTFALNNNCFISTYEYDGGPFYGCYANRLGSDCVNNTFGNECYYNTFGNSCRYNTFGNNYSDNIFGSYCDSNIFGDYCNYNIFGNSCDSNIFGDYCNYNTFGNKCNDNTFGNSCNDNTFGNSCISNTFGNYYLHSQFGNYVHHFSITNKQMTTRPGSEDVESYIQWLTVENGVQYANAYVTTTISNISYCQNVRICSGCSGTYNNYKSFDISSCVDSTVNNVYQPANSQVISV